MVGRGGQSHAIVTPADKPELVSDVPAGASGPPRRRLRLQRGNGDDRNRRLRARQRRLDRDSDLDDAGQVREALSFNGTNAFVTIPTLLPCDLTTGMTLEAWVRPTTVSQAYREVIHKGTNSYYLEATSNHNPAAPAGGGTIGGLERPSVRSSLLPVNTWTHLAFSYDGATMRLYVNGAQVSSSPRTGSIGTSANPLRIGGTSSGSYFPGGIDEVRVYNVALTPRRSRRT